MRLWELLVFSMEIQEVSKALLKYSLAKILTKKSKHIVIMFMLLTLSFNELANLHWNRANDYIAMQKQNLETFSLWLVQSKTNQTQSLVYVPGVLLSGQTVHESMLKYCMSVICHAKSPEKSAIKLKHPFAQINRFGIASQTAKATGDNKIFF